MVVAGSISHSGQGTAQLDSETCGDNWAAARSHIVDLLGPWLLSLPGNKHRVESHDC